VYNKYSIGSRSSRATKVIVGEATNPAANIDEEFFDVPEIHKRNEVSIALRLETAME
jgi:hypothetical protein